jgi:hypothetical protein
MAPVRKPVPPDAYAHNAGFPYSNILFNFPDETGTIALTISHLTAASLRRSRMSLYHEQPHRQCSRLPCRVGESHAIPFVSRFSLFPAGYAAPPLQRTLGMVAQRRRAGGVRLRNAGRVTDKRRN